MFSIFFFQNKLSVADADLYLRSDHSEYIREVLKDTPWGAPCDNCLKDKDMRIPKEPFLLYTYVLNFIIYFYVLFFVIFYCFILFCLDCFCIIIFILALIFILIFLFVINFFYRLIDHEEIFQFLKKAHYEGTTCVAA